MSRPGTRRASRSRGSLIRPLLAVAAGLVLVLVGVFFLGRSMGTAQTTAREFTGEVARFADDGRIVCVEPDDADLPSPFCDVYYVGPDSRRVEIGDRVRVRTLTSTDSDGNAVAGVLLTVLARD